MNFPFILLKSFSHFIFVHFVSSPSFFSQLSFSFTTNFRESIFISYSYFLYFRSLSVCSIHFLSTHMLFTSPSSLSPSLSFSLSLLFPSFPSHLLSSFLASFPSFDSLHPSLLPFKVLLYLSSLSASLPFLLWVIASFSFLLY